MSVRNIRNNKYLLIIIESKYKYEYEYEYEYNERTNYFYTYCDDGGCFNNISIRGVPRQ